MNILLGITGSVATIKAAKLYTELSKKDDVKVVATQKALHFLSDGDLTILNKSLITEDEEWNWEKLGDPVQHIALSEWADILVIAPITANTMAKAARGISDNLLTCILLSWNLDKPIIISPAMNTRMWYNPLTTKNLNILRHYFRKEKHYEINGGSGWGSWRELVVINPVEKKLACGTVGIGAMAEISTIIAEVEKQKNILNEETIKNIIE